MNVDIAYKDGQATLAMVVRDYQDKLLYVTSALDRCTSPHMAEILALEWASKYAEQCLWNKVIWSSDAKEVVKEVKSEDEPTT